MQNLPKKVRSRKLKVDLTAMVSASFLLIVFFMVTTELGKLNMMDLDFSGGGCGPEPVCNRPDENRILTLLLDDNDKMISYMGLIHSPVQKPRIISY